jgi:peptidoglycan/xylan/chitin deacetylase (PgdA/CDA1 family)
MYHRVAHSESDPWGLCVSPEHFAEQLAVLAQYADVVPLEEFTSSLRAGRHSRPVVSITFDDGYADNLHVAKPILARQGAPATVFLATGSIGTGRPYWWDLLTAAVLGPGRVPGRLELGPGPPAFSWSDGLLESGGRRGADARRRLHDALWGWLVDLDDDTRNMALEALVDWCGRRIGQESLALPMTATEVRSLVSDGLVTAGAHTVNHVRLTTIRGDLKQSEIGQSRSDCAALAGRLPACFAYPFGELDDDAAACVRETGYSVACTSEPDLVWQGADELRLPRIMVGNWAGEYFRRQLAWKWFA